MSADSVYMTAALDLARRGLYGCDPNPRVGALLVRDGQIVGEGWHVRAGEPHAEMHALRQAGEWARGADCYVTLEPCCHHGRTPPCSDALIAAGVRRVVVAMRDPNPQVAGQGLAQLQAAGIETSLGLMSDEALALNPGFVSRMQRGRPWLRLKMAMSLDGRTALANGQSQWLTGAAARDDVQSLRARSSAILSGIGTLLADDPRLDPRPVDGELLRQPLRVVLDRDLRLPPQARIFTRPGEVLVLHGAHALAARQQALRTAGASLQVLPLADGGLDLAALMDVLNQRQINELWVEAGPTLAGALIAGGWVDEWVLYVAPKLLGSDAMPLARIGSPEGLDQVRDWRLLETQVLGNDVKMVLRP